MLDSIAAKSRLLLVRHAGSSRVAGGQLQRGASACSRQLDRNCGVTAALHADPSTSQGHFSGIQHMVAAPVGDLSEGLETPVQLLYLVTLLGFLVVGAYLVVRQVDLPSSS